MPSYSLSQPYETAINALKKVSLCESPLSKLETIYNCCAGLIIEDTSKFWQNYDIKASELEISPDQLQAIIVYTVSRLNYPQILSEVVMCESYLPKGVRKSQRFSYLVMIQLACEFITQ